MTSDVFYVDLANLPPIIVVQTTKPFMRDLTVIEPEWLTELAYVTILLTVMLVVLILILWQTPLLSTEINKIMRDLPFLYIFSSSCVHTPF